MISIFAWMFLQEPLLTHAEFTATLDRTESIFRTVLRLPGKATERKGDDKTISRVEIVDGFYGLHSLVKPKFTISLRPVPYDSARISSEFTWETKKRLESLISEGFVAPYGPLVTGQRPGLTIEQYGDALGQFIARTMERTHMPSPYWSPYLQGPDGPPSPKRGG